MGIAKKEGRTAAIELLEPRLLCSATPQNVSELAQANNQFAYELYRHVREQEGNLLLSPLSISTALAMVYAGARGQTAGEMEDVLHFDSLGSGVHDAFDDLTRTIESRHAWEGTSVFHMANGFWGQQGHAFLQSYFDLLGDYYDAAGEFLNFAADPEAARTHINDWIAEQTRDMIQEAIPPGAIDAFTRLVLANTLYLNVNWLYTFEKDDTTARQFDLPGSPMGNMMHQVQRFRYAETADYQAVELPYVNQATSMLVILPKAGHFDAVEGSLSSAVMDQLIASLDYREVDLYLPQLDYQVQTEGLVDILTDMGMPSAFSPPAADFSGMDGQRDLFIDEVLHKAALKMDEKGTEAAAVTVIIMCGTAAGQLQPPPPVLFQADRPFLYVIRDNPTDSTLFVGRVCDGEALVPPDGQKSDSNQTSPPVLWFYQPFKGISPASYFDERYYLADNADVRSAVEAGQFASGLAHFLSFGASEGRAPSGLFDEQFYLRQNPDVAEQVSLGRYRSGFEHYLVFGSREGRNPNALFDELYYVKAAYPDVLKSVASGIFRNGFEHYMLFGAAEGRSPSGFFAESRYRTAETDVNLAIHSGQFRCGLEHYLEFGYHEGRQPLWFSREDVLTPSEVYIGQAFDESWYLSAYGDVAADVASGVFHSALEHFACYGWSEGRSRLPGDDWRLAASIAETATVNGRDVLLGYLYNGSLDVGVT